MSSALHDYGFVRFFAQQVSQEEMQNNRVCRVLEVQRSLITVFDGAGKRSISLTSSLLTAAPDERPTVGDWVLLDNEAAEIERVLERKSVFRRVAAGENADIQLIAANIDVLFIVTSCNEEFNESRLERYLSLAHEAGVIPVIVLTKIDLAEDPDSWIERARGVQSGVAVECVNALDKATFSGVNAWIEPGSTIALVGSSGVGKSTILNSLAGTRIAATSEIREDDKKGRHTTSHRALYKLVGGGLVIDVPGMRELKVAEIDSALAVTFDDIDALAAECRFADCRHESEPGCAVRSAVEDGEIPERRLRNYLKLLHENERNSATLAEKRSQGRAFAKLVKEAKTIKYGQ